MQLGFWSCAGDDELLQAQEAILRVRFLSVNLFCVLVGPSSCPSESGRTGICKHRLGSGGIMIAFRNSNGVPIPEWGTTRDVTLV
jgi:hypothetical protein